MEDVSERRSGGFGNQCEQVYASLLRTGLRSMNLCQALKLDSFASSQGKPVVIGEGLSRRSRLQRLGRVSRPTSPTVIRLIETETRTLRTLVHTGS